MFLFQKTAEVLLRFAEIDVLNVQIVVLIFHSRLIPWFLYGRNTKEEKVFGSGFVASPKTADRHPISTSKHKLQHRKSITSRMYVVLKFGTWYVIYTINTWRYITISLEVLDHYLF